MRASAAAPPLRRLVRWTVRIASRTGRGRRLVDAAKLARSRWRAVRLVLAPAPGVLAGPQLAGAHRDLSRRYDTLAQRLEASTTRARELSTRVEELTAIGGRDSGDRFDEFLKGTNLVLPAKSLQSHLSRLARTADPEAFARYTERLERTQHRRLYEQLFGEELLLVESLNPKTCLERTTFFRGHQDARRAQRRGRSLVDSNRNKYEVTDRLLGTLLHDEDFKEPPRRICEIGGAWGATVKHLTDRYGPEDYQNYEIDTAYGAWVEEELGARAMPVDGETLSGTHDRSVDLVIANNSLHFMPPIKVFSYLSEMARVLEVGGLAVFNLIVADRFDARMLQSYLAVYFPRRAFSLVPQRFVDLAFSDSEFELVRTQYSNAESVYMPYYTYRRVA